MKTILVLGALGLAALFRRPRRTAWTAVGLPAPVGTIPELRTLARELAMAIRSRSAQTAGLIRQFQRRAGLVAINVEDGSDVATASGRYDALTRQALGWYGQLWQEETP